MSSLAAYRENPVEKQRVADLLDLLGTGQRVLDIGTRDGHLAKLLVGPFTEVVALDLERPDIDFPGITPVKGDATALEFPDGHFDAVLCAEVLEHLPPALLAKACSEIARVTKGVAVIGVPLEQDTRLGRMVCAGCGAKNPPWGHVNQFDRRRLRQLFTPALRWDEERTIGSQRSVTNAFSAALMDLAGNPWGTYHQDEPCVECGAPLVAPQHVSLLSRIFAGVAYRLTRLQQRLIASRPQWIHVRFRR